MPAVGSGCIVSVGGAEYLITAGHVATLLEKFGETGRLQIGQDGCTIRNALDRIEMSNSPDLAVMVAVVIARGDNVPPTSACPSSNQFSGNWAHSKFWSRN